MTSGEQYTLRPYQTEAVDAAVDFLKGPAKHNAIEVLPTGSGKSLVLANVAIRLGEPVLIFQPSKEILEQNLSKLQSYGYRGAVYSASKGRTEVSNITFATIGSVIGKSNLFTNFQYVIVDECHQVSSEEGMYKTFLGALTESGTKVLGLTATPYRLVSDRTGSELRFLTSTKPRIFSELIYYVQNRELFNAGYLARMEYVTRNGFDRGRLDVNSTGADYTDESVEAYYRSCNFPNKVVEAVEREMDTRKNALVFTRFVKEAEYLVNNIEGAAIVTGETHKKEREKITEGFKAGDIPVVCNCGVYVVGFDHPQLETVVIAHPTKSLARWYQEIGRGIRPHPEKVCCRVVDLCGNYKEFGRIEDLEIGREVAPYGAPFDNDRWFIATNGKQLTV